MENNILIIVEGAKTESAFFKKLLGVFNQKFEIYCFGTNIYALYKKMKDIGFNGDLKAVLIELHPDQRELLSKRFAYTYLVFDCDVHHPKKDDSRCIEKIIADNFSKLIEMADYFVDETDPSVGKLYINYPMMESYRDCDIFFDKNYKSSMVAFHNIISYKSDVGKRRLSSIHVDSYTEKQFSLLVLQNIYKLNLILAGKWDKPNYEEYLKQSNTKRILLAEQDIAKKLEALSVINTSLFIISDFFGNRDGFYDKLTIKKNNFSK